RRSTWATWCARWNSTRDASSSVAAPTTMTGRPRARRRVARILPCLLLACIATWAQASDEVRLRIEGEAGGYLAWADNTLPGPVEVMLHTSRGDVAGAPALPARATVPARASVLVARVHRTPGARDGGLGLRLDVVPGSVSARPADYEYLFPLDGVAPRVGQAWGGVYSHAGAENLRAVDFAAPSGTTVLAARDGVVMQVEMHAAGSGHGRANLVRILQAAGTTAVD